MDNAEVLQLLIQKGTRIRLRIRRHSKDLDLRLMLPLIIYVLPAQIFRITHFYLGLS